MDLSGKNIGLIGVGNMGTAILEGLLQHHIASPEQIFIYDKIKGKAEGFSETFAVRQIPSGKMLVRSCEVVILAIKPQDLAESAKEFGSALGNSHTLISILAGMTTGTLKKSFGDSVAIVRAMPNLGAKVSQSFTALYSESRDALLIAEKIFSGCGKTVRLGEDYFDLITALSGSGPAYFFLLMEIMAEKAVREGIARDTAELLAVQTALGASLVAESSALSIQALREMVTSKGGTTDAALKVLEKNRLREIFFEAFEAATARGRELRLS